MHNPKKRDFIVQHYLLATPSTFKTPLLALGFHPSLSSMLRTVGPILPTPPSVGWPLPVTTVRPRRPWDLQPPYASRSSLRLHHYAENDVPTRGEERGR